MPDNNKPIIINPPKDLLGTAEVHPLLRDSAMPIEGGKPFEAAVGNTDFGKSSYDNIRPTPLEDIYNGDYKYMRGEQQNGIAQLGLGVGRAIAKAGVEIAKTPAYLFALGESWGDKTLAESLDNAWINSLESLDAKVKETLPVYKSYKSGKGGIMDNIASTSFWASDGADGVGYLLGMMAPGAALKMVNLAGKVSKLGIGAKTAANIELGTQTVLNSSIESLAEAKGVADRLKAEGVDPEKIADAAFNTFMTNMALLVVPNAVMNKNLLGRFTKDKNLLDNFRDPLTGKLLTNPIAKKQVLKDYSKAILGSAASEGLIEEGGQTAIENYEVNKGLGKTNKGFIDGIAEEYLNALTTTEGQKAILLGGVLGGLGGGAGQARESKFEKKITPKLSSLIENNFEGFSVENDIYKRDKDGSIVINPQTAQPDIDVNKTKDAIKNFVSETKASQEKDLAALANDKVLHDYIANEQFTRYAIPFIQQGEVGLEILNEHLDNASKTQHLMNEKSIAQSKQLEFDENTHKASLKNKAKELSKIYDSTLETIKGLDFLSDMKGIDPEVMDNHINRVANAVFQENSKQLFLKETIRDLTIEANQLSSALSADLPQNQLEVKKLNEQIVGLNNLLEQSKKAYETIFDPAQHEAVLKREVKNKKEEAKAEKQAEQTAEQIKKEAPVTAETVVTKDDNDLATSKDDVLTKWHEAIDAEDPLTFNTIHNELQKVSHLLTKDQLEALELKKSELLGEDTAEVERVASTTISDDQDLVSTTIAAPITDNDAVQLNTDRNRIATESENQKGIAYSNSYIAMHLFDHTFKDDLFKWKRNEDGFPKLDNNSSLDIPSINNIRVGDTVSLKLVTLNEKQNAEYLASKKENGTYDEKHIGIYSNSNLIGFVPQAHGINPNSTNKELSKALLKQLIDYRKKVIAKLEAGEEVTETITNKGNGNLYTKIKENGSVDLVSNVFDNFREKDKLDNTLVFAYIKHGNLILPENTDISEGNKSLIKDALSNFRDKNYGKEGKVYQMVQDLTGSWAPIPVYANRMDVSSVRGIMDIISTLDNNSDPADVVKALNDYIYASYKRGQADLFIRNLNNHLEFMLNGDWYSLDRINSSVETANDFKANLKSKFQNINILKINNSFYQQELKARNTLSTNVVTNNGEYFVQPYIEYSTSLSVQTKTPSVKEELNVTTDNTNTQIDNNVDTKDILKDRGISRDDINKALNDDEAFSKHKDATVLDRKEFKSWLSKNLPQLTLSDIEDITRIKNNSVDAFGMFKDSTIYLFEGAGQKTAYHEAFHGVFRNFLTQQEKFDIINEMMSKTDAPTDGDLEFLQDGLNNKYTKEQLTYLFYEEALADEFAEFSQTYNTKSLSQKIKDFFNSILRFFKLISTNDQTKLEKLYTSINKGKFVKAKKVIEGVEVFNRPFEALNDDYAHSRKLDEAGFPPSLKVKFIESIGNQYLKIYQDNLILGRNESYVAIFETIKLRYLNVVKTSNDVKAVAWAEMIYNNFSEFGNEARRFLDLRGIGTSGELLDFQGNLTDENLDDFENTSLEARETKGFRDWTSISGINVASKRIKLMLSSIPVLDKDGNAKLDMFGIQEYYDFNKLYYYIERNLTNLYELDEQIKELKKLSVDRPQIAQVVKMLEIKPSNLDDNQFAQMRNDFKTNFSKQQMAFTLTKFDTNSTTGEVKFRIMDANRQSIGRETLYTWEKNLEDDSRLNTISEFDNKGNIIKYGTKKAKDIYDQWLSLTKRKEVIKYPVANTILSKAGIDFTPEVLQSLLRGNTNEFKDNVKDVLEYYANPSDKTEIPGKRALSKLVGYETSATFESYTSSFNNVENKAIYTIQLPSYASRILNKLRSVGDKFNNVLSDFEQDPFYKDSNILKELKTNRSLMKMSYIDGLKDEKGEAKGSKFTNMTPKDYLSMEVALFQNTSANAGKEASTNIHKYVYITPSDKSMGMIFDSKAYGVNIEEDGRTIAINSQIIGKFYNVFLQEANRIRHNLDIKNDILTNRDKANYTLDELIQYYHISKDNWSAFSKYANKQSNGETLSDDEWNEVAKMFDGQAYSWNYFSGSFNNNIKKLVGQAVMDSTLNNLERNLESFKDDVIKGIRNELTQEFKNTRKEFISKGLIKLNTKTDLLENVSLEIKAKESVEVNNEINKLIASYSLNSLLHNIDFSNILNGDVAQYKPNDLQKRTYQSQASTYNLNFKKPTIKTIVVKDYETGSEEYKDIVISLKKLGFTDEKIKEIASKYEEGINVTDAQVYITPQFYKEIKVARGEWTKELQAAYDIAEGKTVGNISSALHRLLGGIKPYYYGNRFDSKLGIQRYEQVKCAILPLFKTYVDMNPLLASKRQDMELSEVDMMAHESSFKAAIGNRKDILGDVGVVLELDSNNFGIQVDNPDHMDDGNDSMRQLKMLIIGSIDPKKIYKGTKGDSIIHSIMNMEAANIRESFKELQHKMDFKNNLDFANFIKDMITKRGATINIEEALNIVDNNFEYALDNGNLSSQIENMISSVYTNNVIKQEFAIGGSAVQASSIGFQYKNLAEQQEGLTEDAKLLQQQLKWIKPTENGIEYAEAAMPAWTKEFFGKDGKLLDINNIPDELKQLIAYRIPTEGLHSMLPIKVVKFLPETMGNFILLPYEVTTQLGADFDFDKIYFIGREFFKDENGDFKAYKYIDGEAIENVRARYYQYAQYTKLTDRMTFDDFQELPVIEQNPRSSRNNNILDNYLHLLTSIENLHLLITPSGFTTLENFKKQYFPDYQKDNFFSSRTQRDYKERNHIGLALKGQSALHVSGHSYSTLMDLSSETETISKEGNREILRTKAINFNNTVRANFSGLYTDNGNLIADELSSIMAAILDDIKNPLLDPLGINNNTIDVLATIIRSGVNMNSALKFIAQPSIKELSRFLSKNKDGIKEAKQGFYSVDTLLSVYRTNLKETLTKLDNSVDKDSIEKSSFYHNINDTEMETYLGFETKDKSDEELARYYAFQIRVLNNFSNISVIAKDLVNINKFFGINKEVGPNIENIIAKQDIYNEIVNSPTKTINGFDITKIPSLEESFRVHQEALAWFENYFPYSSKLYMEVKNQALALQTTKKLNQVPINDRVFMNNFIRAYSDHAAPVFTNTSNKYDYLFKTLPLSIKNIKDSSKGEIKLGNLTYSQIKDNLFISELRLTFDKNNRVWFITLKGNRLDLQVKNNLIQAFKVLYKNSSTKQLAIDLIEHSFASTGFSTGLNSFSGLIGPDILKELGYNDFRKAIIYKLKGNSLSLPTEERSRMIDQMVRNNPKPFTKVYDESMFIVKGDTITTTINLVKDANRYSDFVLAEQDGNYLTPQYIRVYSKAAKRALIYKQDVDNSFKYNKVSNLGKKGYFLEIDINEPIDKSYLQENNMFKANENTLEEVEDNIASPVLEDEDFYNTLSDEERELLLERNSWSDEDIERMNKLPDPPDDIDPIDLDNLPKIDPC